VALPSPHQRSIPAGEHQFLVSAHLCGEGMDAIDPLLPQVQASQLVSRLMLASLFELDGLVRQFQTIDHSSLQFGEALFLGWIIVEDIAECSDIARDSGLNDGKGKAMRRATCEEIAALAVFKLVHVEHQPMNAILSL
jgi:hypothetical protein